ncbi:MAG TPA: pitrilysin family protein [Mycobacteriales bacterium]|nr:pitrilysin family protein [Mycobacteriales bacterium]
MPPTTPQLPAPAYALERFTLDNGLPVLLAPDRSVPVVAVAVHYDVGMRSEPEGRTGFAHLFEHLMFQGSANLEKLEHFRYVQSSGGTFNGSTHFDYTNYFEMLPSNALERALFLEADRMRSPRINTENLANQLSVVKEEIRVQVMNRPYGGFPWLHLPAVMFDSFANAHNGYGEFADLEAATVDDAAAFFRRYYAPSNALLTVAGDFAVEDAHTMIERHFGSIKSRRRPKLPDFAEPDLTTERRATRTDAHAPMPAVAAAWRVPDPVKALPEYLTVLVLSEMLTDGDASRLERRLVQQDRTVSQLATYLSFMGNPFDVRDPTALVLHLIHNQDVTADQVLKAAHEEFDRLATDGPDPGELERIKSRLVAQILGDMDSVLGRALQLAPLEQQHGRAELISEIPALIGAVTATSVQAAAGALQPGRRAVVELIPEGKNGAAQ